MAAYDSDSSLSDASSAVTTNVLLGYASRTPTDDDISQLGGVPTWLNPGSSPSAQYAQCRNCSSFMPLLLQLNGDMPERYPGHERRLYVWGCRERKCRRKEGSVRVLRGLRMSEQARKDSAKASVGQGSSSSKKQAAPPSRPAQRTDLGNTLFGATASQQAQASNPFASTTSNSSRTNPFSAATIPQITVESLPATFAQKAQISEKEKSAEPRELSTTSKSSPSQVPRVSWPDLSQQAKPYPRYFLDAEYEYISPTSNEAQNGESASKVQLMEYELDDEMADAGTGSRGSSKKKESSKAQGSDKNELKDSTHDKTFSHFASILDQNPDQVLRYEFGGQPLLYNSRDTVGRLLNTSKTSSATVSSSNKGPPRCQKCGASRSFECQLTPHAISELEDVDGADAAELLAEGMEWGTIIVYVCSKDCAGDFAGNEKEGEEVLYVEEWAGVQWEEQASKMS